jgi:hypothetical protein
MLMSREMAECYQTLLYGNEAQKASAPSRCVKAMEAVTPQGFASNFDKKIE